MLFLMRVNLFCSKLVKIEKLLVSQVMFPIQATVSQNLVLHECYWRLSVSYSFKQLLSEYNVSSDFCS